MSRRFWVTSSLVRRPLIFCWVFRGRTPRSERLLVGQTDVSEAKRSTFGLAGPAELKHLAAGLLLHGGLRAGDAGHRGQADRDGAAELPLKGLADLCRGRRGGPVRGRRARHGSGRAAPFGPAAASRSRD